MSKAAEQNHVEFLSQVSFFSEVSTTSLEHLCTGIKEENYRKNALIFKKGTVGDSMYVIVNGKVKVHEDNHIYGELEKGDCFGEYALIDNDLRSASITTVKRTTVLRIERQYFLDLMANDSGLAQGVLAVMIKRHRDLDVIQEQLASSKEALEMSSSKMKGLINGVLDAIIMFDSNFRIVLTNPSANVLLENDDVNQRNVLFFFDDEGARLIESLVQETKENKGNAVNNFIPDVIKVIGSNESESLNEGTISMFGNDDDTFYTLILRNIEERLKAEDQISLLTKQTQYLQEEIKELTGNYGIIAEDIGMKSVLNLIDQVAATDATVLITGETGTGKELVARAIHKASNRNDKPLIRINCGAIPHHLIESELFGHKKGAFTGASADRKGRFLLADKGTIFLDEIGEMPLELQPKLLRVIQEGEFDPVGSSETITVDVRIIAATHRNLIQLAKDGSFREDLYYRLNVFPIKVPPLRERGKDIILIAQDMIDQFSKKFNKQKIDLSEADKSLLSNYHWPGNVRELQNLLERALIVSQKGMLNFNEILHSPSSGESQKNDSVSNRIWTAEELIELEKQNIIKALKLTRWKVSGVNGAAALLKLPPTTLSSKMKALGIERPV